MKTETMTLKFKKDTKWTRVFETDDPNAPIKSVYVDKRFAGTASQIKLTVEVA